MKISYIDRRKITGQAIINGRLVTEFVADTDPVIGYPAGTLVCEPCTSEQCAAYHAKYGDDDHGGILSETVTRLKHLFWDRGTFTARA